MTGTQLDAAALSKFIIVPKQLHLMGLPLETGVLELQTEIDVVVSLLTLHRGTDTDIEFVLKKILNVVKTFVEGL